ncbi:hypothetical protein P1X14_18910 [Sphingomonas sp. AOB5]|uniref:hypothetical protein n=1 Tax=Sphingomonas sp. AOB5 TaxID=3034017 RepID=UPI0023F992C4|nr:hypothetical protein [Sphingomonas sp. AOB5]MDF7777336.1 hypothetical protein [Sphingomonas sp. AOB5]
MAEARDLTIAERAALVSLYRGRAFRMERRIERSLTLLGLVERGLWGDAPLPWPVLTLAGLAEAQLVNLEMRRSRRRRIELAPLFGAFG